MLLLVPVIGVVVVSLMAIGKRFPKSFNYPVKVTAENIARQQSLAINLLDNLRFVVALMLGFISIQQMRAALGVIDGVGAWFVAVALIGVFGTLGIYLVRAVRAR